MDFFETYWRLIYNAAIKSGLIDAEAQDVVQETVISVFKQMPGFEYHAHGGSFKSWLLNLTRWRITDQLRKRKREVWHQKPKDRPDPDSDSEMEEQIEDSATADWQATWDADWEQNLIDAAIRRVKTRVNSKAYQMFDLHVFKEWPVARVARAFHVNQAKVYLAKHRIGNLIKEEVKKLQTDENLSALGIQSKKECR